MLTSLFPFGVGQYAQACNNKRRCDVTQSRFGVMLLLALTLFASLAVATARAQTASTEAIPNHPALSDRFAFQLGGYYASDHHSGGAGGTRGGGGVAIDFESALGLEERPWCGIGGFLWRMTERWRLEVEYFQLNRDASRNLVTDIEWNGRLITAGTTVNSSYDFSDTRVSVGYSFFKRRDKEFGVGFGLHVADIKANIQDTTGGNAEAADVTAPLPVISFYGAFALTDQWAVRTRIDWLSLHYGDYSGGLRNTAVDVLYQPFRNVGFGLGMRTLVLDMDVDSPIGRARRRRFSRVRPRT